MITEEDKKRIKELRYIDDIFMRASFNEDDAPLKRLLSVVLGLSNLTFTSKNIQRNLPNLYGRSSIIDVHAVDDKNREYAIEIQRESSGANVKRARYISSLVDAQMLKSGTEPKDMADSYVVFITEHDIFKEGKPIYYIESCIKGGDTYKPVQDGRHIVYVNCEYKSDDEIGRLIYDILCSDPDKMYNEEFAKPAYYLKNTPEGERKMSAVLEEMRREAEQKGIAIGRAEGEAKGRAEGEAGKAKLIALNLLKMGGLTQEQIAQSTQLSLDYIKELQKEIE